MKTKIAGFIMPKSWKKISLLICMLFFVCGCGKTTYTVDVVDGVDHIRNHEPVWGNDAKVRLEFVQKIGVLDGTDENYLLFGPRYVSRDKMGFLYIADTGNHRIQKYDSEGKYILTFGRQGQGPGEFMSINGMDIDNIGNIYVSDNEGFRIQIFSPEGVLIKGIKHQKEIIQIRLLEPDGIVTWDFVTATQFENSPNPWILGIYDYSGNRKTKIGNIHDYGSYSSNFQGNQCWFAVTKDGNIFCSYRSRNRIEKYSSDGDLLLVSERPLDYDITPIKRTIKTRDNNTMTVLDFKPVSWFIDVDNSNRLWVPTYSQLPKTDQEEESYPQEILLDFHLFDQNGILLGKIPSPVDFLFLRIFDNHLYLLDPMNEMCVYEYLIVTE